MATTSGGKWPPRKKASARPTATPTLYWMTWSRVSEKAATKASHSARNAGRSSGSGGNRAARAARGVEGRGGGGGALPRRLHLRRFWPVSPQPEQRLADFELREGWAFLFGQGYPKSLDVSKAIDRAEGAVREVVGLGEHHARRTAATGGGATICREGGDAPIGHIITAPATNAARQWEGYGTTTKPAFEPLVVARKTLDGRLPRIHRDAGPARHLPPHRRRLLSGGAPGYLRGTAADAAASVGLGHEQDGSMANERKGVSELTPEGTILYAAHTAVAQGQRSKGDGQVDASSCEGQHGADERARKGNAWARYLTLSFHQLERVAPAVAFQTRVVGNMLRPGGVYGARGGTTRHEVVIAETIGLAGMMHRERAASIDLSPISSLPEERSNATDLLLHAAVHLMAPVGDAMSSPFDADLRRLAAADTSILSPKGELSEAERWLDLAEREFEDVVVVDLSEGADRARITRRELEGLARANIIPRLEAKKRQHVHPGALRRALGLPFLFPPTSSPRVDGAQEFARGRVHFVRGAAPIALDAPADGGYLEFTPRDPAQRAGLAQYRHRPCSAKDLGLDPAALSLWARAWSRERFGRPLAPNPDWYVVAGDELARRVQSVAVFNVLQQV